MSSEHVRVQEGMELDTVVSGSAGRTAASGFAQLYAWGQQCSAVPVWAVGPFADRRVLARKRGAP
jgi:hypothetical protein